MYIYIQVVHVLCFHHLFGRNPQSIYRYSMYICKKFSHHSSPITVQYSTVHNGSQWETNILSHETAITRLQTNQGIGRVQTPPVPWPIFWYMTLWYATGFHVMHVSLSEDYLPYILEYSPTLCTSQPLTFFFVFVFVFAKKILNFSYISWMVQP